MRYLFAGCVLLALLLVQRRTRDLSVIRDRPGALLFLAMTGMVGMGTMVTVANKWTRAIEVGVLLNSNPVLIALLAAFLGERLSMLRIGGVAVGLAGCALVLVGTAPETDLEQGTSLLGCAAALVGALCWAVYTLASKPMVRQYGAVPTTTGAILVGAVLLGAAVVVFDRPVNLHPHIVLIMAFVGLVPTAVAFTLWNVALRYIDAGTAGPLQYVSPVGAMLIAWPALGEVPTWPLLARRAPGPSGWGAFSDFEPLPARDPGERPSAEAPGLGGPRVLMEGCPGCPGPSGLSHVWAPTEWSRARAGPGPWRPWPGPGPPPGALSW